MTRAFPPALPARRGAIAAPLVLALALAACQTTDPATRQPKTSEAVKGGVGGALAGGSLCAVLSALNGDNGAKIAQQGVACAAAFGAVGALNGALADERDRQLLAEFQQAGLSVSVRENNLVLDSASDIRFAAGSARPQFAEEMQLSSVAKILNRFPQRAVEIVGHTGAGEADGLGLSRASSVRAVLARDGVDPARVRVSNHAHREPVAPDDAPLSAYRNRRVEIFFVPAA